MAKIYEVGLKLSAALDPKMRGAFASAQNSLRALGDGMKTMQDKLGNMDAWRKLSAGVKDTKQQFALAKQEMERTRAILGSVENPTRQMASAFAQAKDRVFDLGDKLRSQRAQLGDLAAAMEKAGISTRNFGAEQQRLQEQMAKMSVLREKIAANTGAIQANDARKAALKQKMLGPLAGVISPGLLGMAGVVQTVRRSAAYEHALNQVQATGTFSDEQRKTLDKHFRYLGRTTEFTESDAAKLGLNFTRAGLTPQQILEASGATMNMATANSMGLDETSSILADQIKSWGYRTDQTARMASILTKSANSANMDVRLLAEAANYGAANAKSLGLTPEQFGAMIGAVSNRGIKGSMAGTGVNEFLARLAKPTKEVNTAFKQLGIKQSDLRDKNGNMRDVMSIIAMIAKKTEKMGNLDEVGALTGLAGKRGSRALIKLIEASRQGELKALLDGIENSDKDGQRYVDQAAAKMREGLTGSFARLSSAWEGFTHSLFTDDAGKGLAKTIDGIAEKLNSLTDWFSKHQDTVTFIAELAAKFVALKMAVFASHYAFLQLKGGFLAVKGVVLAGQAAMLLYKGGLTALTAAYGANSAIVKTCTAAQWLWNAALNANPIGLVVTAVAGLAAGAVLLYNKWEPFRKWWDETWTSIKENTAAAWDWIKSKASGVADWFSELPDKFKGWISAIPDHFVEMVKLLPSKIAESFEEFGRWVKAKLKEFFTFNINFGDVGKKVGAGVSAWQKGAPDPSGSFDMNVPGSAAGRKTAGPMLSLIGEGAAPEYVIPTESRYRSRALELWQQAGKDLGVPMYAKGEQLGSNRPNMGVFAWDPMIMPESFGEKIFSDKPVWKSVREFISSLTALDFWDAHDFYSQFKGPASLLAPYLSAQYKFMGAQNMDKWSKFFAIGSTGLTLYLSNMIANASSSLKRKSNKSNIFGEWGRKLKDFFSFNVSFRKDAGGFDMNVPGSAAGRKTAGPMLSLIGEGAAPEYVIPTESRYRARALELWQQAGKDLGVPMFENGKDNNSLIDERGIFGFSWFEVHDFADTFMKNLKYMTALSGYLAWRFLPLKWAPWAIPAGGIAGSAILSSLNLGIGRLAESNKGESLLKRTEQIKANTKNVTNNVVINAKVTGIENAEEFVNRLQKFGLTFDEHADNIYMDNDEDRLAFSE